MMEIVTYLLGSSLQRDEDNLWYTSKCVVYSLGEFGGGFFFSKVVKSLP